MKLEKLWSNWMIPFLTTRAVDSSLFAVAQGDEKPSSAWWKPRALPTCGTLTGRSTR